MILVVAVIEATMAVVAVYLFDTNINGLMSLVTSGKSTELLSNVNKLPVIEER